MTKIVRLQDVSARPALRPTRAPAPRPRAVARTAAALAGAVRRLLHIAPRPAEFEDTRPLERPPVRVVPAARRSPAGSATPRMTWLAEVEVLELEMGELERRSLFGDQGRQARAAAPVEFLRRS
jgi:hypothetical protein